jgi:hypothetical protein
MKIGISLASLVFFSTWLVSCSDYSHKSHNQKTGRLRNAVLGLWGGPNEDHPVWKITADSIYYFQERRAYKYTLSEDSLVIQFPDHSYCLKDISVIGDTMVFNDEIGKVSAYRFNSKGRTRNLIK